MPTALHLLAQTGFGSPIGKVVVLIGLLAALVVIARWWWQNRGR